MAATVRGIWNWDNGVVDYHGDWLKRPLPSIPQLWELYEKRRPELEEAVSSANAVIRVVRMARAVAATAWIVTGEIECDRCSPAVVEERQDFYEQLTMQHTGAVSDGAMTFIRLMNRRGAGGGDDRAGRVGYTQTDQLALIFKAWNAYREGKPVTTLAYKRGGRHPEKFPVPH